MVVLQVQSDDVPRALDVLLALGARELELVDGRALGLFPDPFDPATARRAEALLGAPVTVAPAEMLDWSSVWRPTVRPFRVGPLTVSPLGERGDLVLDMSAFGTGHHPTTRMCLERLAERVPAGPVLDVGTGSGVLALVALVLGAPSAVGTDLEPAARRVAAENAARNGLADRFTVRATVPDATFALVLANLQGGLLGELVADLSRRVASGGELVLSGFTVDQRDDVARGWTRQGLRVVGTAERGGWARLDLAVPW